jgi:hypothetical protein
MKIIGEKKIREKNTSIQNMQMSGWWLLAGLLLVAALVMSIIALVQINKKGISGGSGSGSGSGGGSSSASSPISNFIALSSNLGDGLAQGGTINWNPTGTTDFQLDDDHLAFNGTTTVTTWSAGTYDVQARIWASLVTGPSSAVKLEQRINGVAADNAHLTVTVSEASTTTAGLQVVAIDLTCLNTNLAAGSLLTFFISTDNSAIFDLQGGYLKVERI